MLDWLNPTQTPTPTSPVLALMWRIGLAACLGAAVGALYRWARRGEPRSPTFIPTLVLLAAVIAMATQVIGDNVARAFSLVGALSVVRFRTVVKDTLDTAFVIFSVVVGMASGASQLVVALVGLAVVAVATILLWPPRRSRDVEERDAHLIVRLDPTPEVRGAVEELIALVSTHYDVRSVSTAKQGPLLEVDYRLRLKRARSLFQTVAQLSQCAGVERVDLRRSD